MKICSACGVRFDGNDFCCLSCGHSPDVKDRHLIFGSEPATGYDGFEAKFFEHLAVLEEGNFWFEYRNDLLTWALQRYFPDASTFLEIGCGTGFVLSGIQREFRNLKLFGSDIFSEGLIYAGNRLPAAMLFQMDARNIPFENEFDVVGAFDVIEHIDEDEIVLSQIFRSVKSLGGIILTVPQHPWLWSKGDEIACHKRRYSKKELAVKMENAGFRILCMKSFVSFLLPLMAISRLRWHLGVGPQKDCESELRLHPFINTFFKKICGFEKTLIRKGVTFQLGGSILCAGIKV
jgi:SAM-dependent methyltransferase